MEKIHFSTHIEAPPKKVWDTMLAKETYPIWTAHFSPGSRYEGSWDEGAEIRFLGPNPDGSKGEGGMYSRIKTNRPYEFLSIEHLGMIENGIIDTTSEKVRDLVPAFENYTFKEVDGGTELLIEMNTNDEYKAMFEGMWPKALAELKQLAEDR